MAKQTIGVGVVANDDTGDYLRPAMIKVNENFSELYDAFSAFADVAYTGDYNDLNNLPVLGTFDGDYNSLTNRPDLGTASAEDVAFFAVSARGLPSGGLDGYILAKASNANYDVEWIEDTGGGGGITEVVSDTSPQLGGDLDLNSFDIIDHVIGVDIQAWAAVLDGTTASFTTADETKLDALPTAASLSSSLALKANLASPTLSGTPTAPTATLGTDSTQIATMAAVLAATDADVIGPELENLSSANKATFLTAVLPEEVDEAVTFYSTLGQRLGGTVLYIPDPDPEDLDPPPILAAGQVLELVAEVDSGLWSMINAAVDTFDTSISTWFVTDDTGEPIAITDVEASARLLASFPGAAANSFAVFDGTTTFDSVTYTEAKALLFAGLTGVLRSDNGVISVDSDVTDIVSAASTTVAGVVELTIASEINTGTSTTLAITPDSLAGSYAGTEAIGICVFKSDEIVTVGNGTVGAPIPDHMAGMDIIGVRVSTTDKGVTGATDVQVRRRRDGSDVDVLSTKVTLGNEWTVADGVINAAADDLAAGDIIFVDVDAIHSGTAPNGLYVSVSARLP